MQTQAWRELYPFTSRYQTIGSLKYHYLDEGPDGLSSVQENGADTATDKIKETLLFVHGNPTWSFYWRNLMTHFRQKHRTVAVDHLGCGLSDKPQDYNYNLKTHIENLVEFIKELDLKDITLLVHDWGGAIGLGAATQLPDRFRRFVIFNTAAFPPPYFPWRIRACRFPILGNWALRGLNLFSRAALKMAICKQERLTPAIASGLLAPYDSWENRVAVQRFVQDIPTSPNQPTWQLLEKIERELSQFEQIPVCMVWGMKDWCFRAECLGRLSGIFPRSVVHPLPDAGHYLLEDAHEEIIPIVEQFLTRDSFIATQ
ncbi:MAG: alpha/beta fold hydrolase [Pirellulaceae bacterium]|nr:alpha/beta fold hydrolase [Pirellulaceae bacterium]